MTPKPPLFVAIAGYRHRRAIDGARLLPILGAFLVFLPLLWAGGGTRNGIVYIFSVWIGLIFLAAFLSRRLAEPPNEPPNERANEPLSAPRQNAQEGPGDGSV